LGFETLGYDPYFPGKDLKCPADWVLLFYVINVIEDLAEREAVLLDAYRLAKKGLAVGVTPKERLTGHERPYADGRLTTINTFFTSYDWNRAKRYVRAVLGLQPILKDAVLWAPVGIGEPIAHYQLSPSQLRERIRDYEDQIQDLISTTLDDHGRCPIWGSDCTLQPYQTRGVRRYRVFSDSGQADGKRYLYAGTGEPWGWVMERFINRDKLAILQDRLEYSYQLSVSS